MSCSRSNRLVVKGKPEAAVVGDVGAQRIGPDRHEHGAVILGVGVNGVRGVNEGDPEDPPRRLARLIRHRRYTPTNCLTLGRPSYHHTGEFQSPTGTRGRIADCPGHPGSRRKLLDTLSRASISYMGSRDSPLNWNFPPGRGNRPGTPKARGLSNCWEYCSYHYQERGFHPAGCPWP